MIEFPLWTYAEIESTWTISRQLQVQRTYVFSLSYFSSIYVTRLSFFGTFGVYTIHCASLVRVSYPIDIVCLCLCLCRSLCISFTCYKYLWTWFWRVHARFLQSTISKVEIFTNQNLQNNCSFKMCGDNRAKFMLFAATCVCELSAPWNGMKRMA